MSKHESILGDLTNLFVANDPKSKADNIYWILSAFTLAICAILCKLHYGYFSQMIAEHGYKSTFGIALGLAILTQAFMYFSARLVSLVWQTTSLKGSQRYAGLLSRVLSASICCAAYAASIYITVFDNASVHRIVSESNLIAKFEATPTFLGLSNQISAQNASLQVAQATRWKGTVTAPAQRMISEHQKSLADLNAQRNIAYADFMRANKNSIASASGFLSLGGGFLEAILLLLVVLSVSTQKAANADFARNNRNRNGDGNDGELYFSEALGRAPERNSFAASQRNFDAFVAEKDEQVQEKMSDVVVKAAMSSVTDNLRRESSELKKWKAAGKDNYLATTEKRVSKYFSSLVAQVLLLLSDDERQAWYTEVQSRFPEIYNVISPIPLT
jgi:hypothetical protein